MDNIWLLPVSRVNSSNTAWHLETQKKKKKTQVGSRRGLRVRFPEECAPWPTDEHPVYAQSARIRWSTRASAARDHWLRPIHVIYKSPAELWEVRVMPPYYLSILPSDWEKKGKLNKQKFFPSGSRKEESTWMKPSCLCERKKRKDWRKPSLHGKRMIT